jgi:hypothetical protein
MDMGGKVVAARRVTKHYGHGRGVVHAVGEQPPGWIIIVRQANADGSQVAARHKGRLFHTSLCMEAGLPMGKLLSLLQVELCALTHLPHVSVDRTECIRHSGGRFEGHQVGARPHVFKACVILAGILLQ